MTYEANVPITFGETTIQFDVYGELIELPAKAVLRLLPSPRLVIECIGGPSMEHMQLDATQSHITASLFDVRTEFVIGQTVLTFGKASRVGLTLLPKREPVSIYRSGKRIVSLEFAVLNFPNFLLGQDKKVVVGTQWRVLGSALLQAGGWEIEITAVTALTEIEKKLKEEGGYAITHTGTVKRSDGDDFAAQDVEPLLSALRLFLSFARGTFCGLALVVGKDCNGESAWEQWGTHRVTEWSNPSPSWFDRMNGYILAEAFPGFWKLWQDHDQLVRMAVDLYLHANLGSHGAGYEGGLILTQAALERFSHCVESSKAGVRIERALRNMGISKAALRISPESCPELAIFGRKHSWKHGPHALVELRNNIVHPEDKYDNMSQRVYYEAWNLAQWYLELTLLKLCEYEGNYGNRLNQKRVGEVEPLGQWLVENMPRGTENPDRRESGREIPFVSGESVGDTE